MRQVSDYEMRQMASRAKGGQWKCKFHECRARSPFKSKEQYEKHLRDWHGVLHAEVAGSNEEEHVSAFQKRQLKHAEHDVPQSEPGIQVKQSGKGFVEEGRGQSPYPEIVKRGEFYAIPSITMGQPGFATYNGKKFKYGGTTFHDLGKARMYQQSWAREGLETLMVRDHDGGFSVWVRDAGGPQGAKRKAKKCPEGTRMVQGHRVRDVMEPYSPTGDLYYDVDEHAYYVAKRGLLHKLDYDPYQHPPTRMQGAGRHSHGATKTPGSRYSIKDFENFLAEKNREDGSTFSIAGAYGQWELWGGDPPSTRIETGSPRDLYNAWVKVRFSPKFSRKQSAGRMKIKPEDYKRLKNYIIQAINDPPNKIKEKYPRGDLRAIMDYYAKKGLSSQRMRWDLLWASGAMDYWKGGMELSTYMNDAQIDTALKAIVSELLSGNQSSSRKVISLKKGYITEQEIQLARQRKNAGEEPIKFPYSGEGIKLSPEQNRKGINYLMGLWKTPSGKERSNCPFGYREKHVLENFKEFRLIDWYDASHYQQAHNYFPYYRVRGKDGSTFEYVFYNGQVHILG